MNEKSKWNDGISEKELYKNLIEPKNEIPITKKDITFYGNTEEEKKANEMIFDLSMTIDRQQQELDQYKNNWEELKTYLEQATGNLKIIEHDDYICYENVLNKMKELEEEK